MRTLSIKRAQIEPSPMPKVVQEKKEGCFIATVCYGDYNSKEVLSLREYRDTTLSKTVFGKMFIRLYYFASPPTAKLIEKSSWMKKTIRLLILEPIVNRIGCNKKAANNA